MYDGGKSRGTTGDTPLDTSTADITVLAKHVDKYLAQTLDAFLKKHEIRDSLADAARYAVMGGGHRWRPVFLIQTGMMYGAPLDYLLPAAAAVELLHCASLIIDDLPAFDNADTRRGRPACHVQHGEHMTVLAFALLLTFAYEQLDRKPGGTAVAYPPELRLNERARDVATAMTSGEADDLAADMTVAGAHAPDRQAELDRICAAKTGRLLRFAVEAGALIACAPQADVARLNEFADNVALAYQYLDDVSDADGTAWGKPSGQGKHRLTAVSVHGLPGARDTAYLLLNEALAALSAMPQSEPLAFAAQLLCRARQGLPSAEVLGR